MRTDIHIEQIQQEYEFRKDALEGFKTQARVALQQEFDRVMTSLNPPKYDDTLYRLRGLRFRKTGVWLFMNETFTEWFNSSQETPILWIKGIPGAGRHIFFFFPCAISSPVNASKTLVLVLEQP
jgi:hypothetical protein